eukprot:179130-Chlamydomonas_euryale.AAC.8
MTSDGVIAFWGGGRGRRTVGGQLFLAGRASTRPFGWRPDHPLPFPTCCTCPSTLRVPLVAERASGGPSGELPALTFPHTYTHNVSLQITFLLSELPEDLPESDEVELQFDVVADPLSPGALLDAGVETADAVVLGCPEHLEYPDSDALVGRGVWGVGRLVWGVWCGVWGVGRLVCGVEIADSVVLGCQKHFGVVLH